MGLDFFQVSLKYFKNPLKIFESLLYKYITNKTIVMKEKKNQKCCLCGKMITGYGHSALPVMGGRCCDLCNSNKVIPTRKELLDAISRGHI